MKIKSEPKTFNYYYETSYTSNTASGICKLYKELRNKMKCKYCKNDYVDIKAEVQDTYYPTFVIVRSYLCHSCYIKSLY